MNYKLTAALLLFCLSILIGTAGASCGTVPASISSSITACQPANIVNTQGTGTSSGFQVELGSLPFNAMLGNVVVYNSVSGALMPSWIEANNIIWVNLGANTIGASSSANGIYYFGFGNAGTNFLSSTSANQIGEAPQLSASYAQYDNGNTVFGAQASTAGLYDDFYGSTLKSSWHYGTGTVAVNNGLTASTIGAWWDITNNYQVTAPFVLDTY